MNPGACILDAFGQRASRTICFGCEAIAYFFILLNYFWALALWKLWKKKLTACWASLFAKNYLWKTCGKAGAVVSPSVLVQKLF
jgi:hypothetical protein